MGEGEGEETGVPGGRGSGTVTHPHTHRHTLTLCGLGAPEASIFRVVAVVQADGAIVAVQDVALCSAAFHVVNPNWLPSCPFQEHASERFHICQHHSLLNTRTQAWLLTCVGESQLPAQNTCASVIPRVVTDGPPRTVEADVNSSLVHPLSSCQSSLTISTRGRIICCIKRRKSITSFSAN